MLDLLVVTRALTVWRFVDWSGDAAGNHPAGCLPAC